MKPRHFSGGIMACRQICCLVFIIICHSATLSDPCGRNASSTDIHIIGFFPCTDLNDTRGVPVDNCDGIERIPIMKLALEEINERCDLLPGYRLVVNYANSACSSIPATYHLIQQTDPSQPNKLMILGPACSLATYLMGEIAQRKLNIPQVAYTASDSVFGTDKQRYPRFYRLVPITKQAVDGYIALVKELNWKRVAIVSHGDDFNIHLLKYSEEQLTKHQLHVTLAAIFVDDPRIVLNQIKKSNARIIIAWIPHHAAVKFWCSVIKYRLSGPNFVWFLPGWLRTNWWVEVGGTNCTAAEMSSSLEHTLSGRGNNMIDDDPTRILVSNKSVTQFKQDLNSKISLGSVRSDIFLSTGYVYDAVWTIALALNSSISILKERGLGRLEDFTYESINMADVFTEAIAATSFQGISGKVSFLKSGNKINPSIQLFQFIGGKVIPVMVYKPSGNKSDHQFYNISNQSFTWPGGQIPIDVPVPVIISSTTAEYIITGVTTVIGILSSIFFFIFNLYYKNHLAVKRSSYRLNLLILIAVFIGFIGTLLYIIKLSSDMPTSFTTTVCNAREWTSQLAFTVAFGTLSVKIWRLYKIFCNKRMLTQKYLDDHYLFIMIAIISTPTLMLIIVRVAAFPVMLMTSTTVNENDLSTAEIYSECSGSHKFIFLGLAYAMGIILGIFSMVLAYETQKNLPQWNDLHKYRESAVINLTTMLAILLSSVCQVVYIILRLSKLKDGALLVVTLQNCLWMYPIIYLLFVPKVYKVYFGRPSTFYPSSRKESNTPSTTSMPSSPYRSVSGKQPSRRFSRQYSSVVSHSNTMLSPVHEQHEEVCSVPNQLTSEETPGPSENTSHTREVPDEPPSKELAMGQFERCSTNDDTNVNNEQERSKV